MRNKVLIVEDEFIVANDLRLILLQAGYSVTGMTASAEEAVEHLQKQKPDIVILDIRLSGKLSGIDLAKKLKAENIAFIYLSANSNQKVLEEAKTTEPYGFIVKPFREKDLLVTLDIARYRHEHSLESKLRKEAQLQKQLTDISNDTTGTRQKLLKVAMAMQSYIPFDLIACGIRPFNTGRFTDAGYLRTGFDEYQFIGENELMTMAGVNEKEFYAITESSRPDDKAGFYNNGATNENNPGKALQTMILDCLRLESYLVFPVNLSYGLSVQYFFYSRKAGVYIKEHIALLHRLKLCLEDLAEKIIYYSTSQPAVNGPASSMPKKAYEQARHAVFENVIGSHHLLLDALDLAAQVAPYNTSVLILGESGAGKEKIAQSIHTLSPRKSRPFIKVNCAAIPATLVESELFGHEKGAFTGAIEKRKGKFEQADGGTIFLDEIGELPLAAQVKLLRVLQEREIEHIGGKSPIKVDVRIVAATNRNLEKEMAQGAFRLDLYYRLNVFPITLPPLRDRKTDIEPLATFFASKFCKAFNKPFIGIATSMMEEMQAYDWPGNIRELENVLEQSVVLNDGKSKLTLMRGLRVVATKPGLKPGIDTLQDVKDVQRQTEKDYLIAILKKTNGRIRGANGAATLLNIKPTTLESKMAKLNISRLDFMKAPDSL